MLSVSVIHWSRFSFVTRQYRVHAFVISALGELGRGSADESRVQLYHRKMSASSKKGSRKRGAGPNPVSETVTRTTRSRRNPIKIEVEKDVNEDKQEPLESVSEYFSENVQQPKSEMKTEDFNEEIDDLTNNEEKEKKRPSESPGKKKAKPEPVKVEPPENWKTILDNIKIMRSTKTAVVDSMGCERTADLTKEPKVQRFHTLVSLMLSSQTKDQVTFAAMERLKARELSVQSMLDVDETELGEIIKPVGFYKRKASYIKRTAEILRNQYNDDIPKTVDDLCSLPGVGPKMAYICMNAAWNENAGIGVDTHVHRISNRLKWTGKNGTNTPEKTREALESWMPRDLWQEFNILLVGFGQETCLPIGPKCASCLNKDICPASTARGGKSKSKPKNEKKK